LSSAAATTTTAPRRARSFGRGLVSKSAVVLMPLAALAFLIGLWELLVHVLDVKEFILPPPSAIADEAVSQWSLLLSATKVTLIEVLLGFALSIVVAIPIALMIVFSKVLRNVLYPLFVAGQAIPRIAIAPLMVLWFGLGTEGKVMMAFSIAVFPLLINTVVGLQSIDRETLYVVRSMGAGPIQSFFKVRLHAALPSIYAGLKIAVTLAVIGAIVGEFVGSKEGLGYLVIVGQGTLNTRLIFASVLLMALMGIVLFYALEILERITIHWYYASRAAADQGGAPPE
jgi:NitT/TauT family transport system permease protein